jgi:hypothetical protein
MSEELYAAMTDHSRETLKWMEVQSDCTVQTSDEVKFKLLKSSLAERSVVFR